MKGTIMYKERGEKLLMEFAEKLSEEGLAKIEMMPKVEGKKMAIMLAPKGKK
jgi:translation initiation factor IF-3